MVEVEKVTKAQSFSITFLNTSNHSVTEHSHSSETWNNCSWFRSASLNKLCLEIPDFPITSCILQGLALAYFVHHQCSTRAFSSFSVCVFVFFPLEWTHLWFLYLSKDSVRRSLATGFQVSFQKDKQLKYLNECELHVISVLRPTVREVSAFYLPFLMHSVSTSILFSALEGRAVKTTLYASLLLALWLDLACGKPNQVVGGGRRIVVLCQFPWLPQCGWRVEWFTCGWLYPGVSSATVVSSLPVHVFGDSLLLNPQWITLIFMCCFLLGSQCILHMSGSACYMDFSWKVFKPVLFWKFYLLCLF